MGTTTMVAAETFDNNNTAMADAGNIAISVKEVRQETDNILKQEKVPSEGETLAVLEKLQKLAAELSSKETTPESRDANRDGTPASALLSLDGKPVSTMSLKQTTELISNLAHRIVRHPTVFITPIILNTYTNIQLRLHRPSLLPEIFDLYASKPIPQPNTHPIQYQPSQLHAPANAIPVPLATRALTAAITAKDLATALSLIETSYRAPAYRRAKALKSALPAVLACGLTPIASYATATHLSAFFGLNGGASTGVFAAGLLTYAGVVAAMGYVALTTANDQMRRVTWTDGTALWARWVREEERAAADEVALTWGFAGRERWGEEEGPEWEFLREWIGERGMVLDRVSLMEGME
ncbi:MAG: hypothetical protein M1821_003369 [Bathelium mastoideum]|nr:MAG: hypothetical protein M1821_003369 [Bathelium mastoideum]